LKNQQDLELNNKGVDTERLKIIEDCLTEITEDLSFIRSNERTVFKKSFWIDKKVSDVLN
jgi:molybdopterin-biosynthesis enzyme MoeA-like protein